jgi:hypothetical protein
MSEAPLSGGRVTPGVARVGGTVRRPPKTNVAFVRGLLAQLAKLGLDVAPRYLGSDEQGRETFSYLEGEVPDELNAGFSDATLASAARLIRRYHDATAGSTLAGGCEMSATTTSPRATSSSVPACRSESSTSTTPHPAGGSTTSAMRFSCG